MKLPKLSPLAWGVLVVLGALALTSKKTSPAPPPPITGRPSFKPVGHSHTEVRGNSVTTEWTVRNDGGSTGYVKLYLAVLDKSYSVGPVGVLAGKQITLSVTGALPSQSTVVAIKLEQTNQTDVPVSTLGLEYYQIDLGVATPTPSPVPAAPAPSGTIIKSLAVDVYRDAGQIVNAHVTWNPPTEGMYLLVAAMVIDLDPNYRGDYPGYPIDPIHLRVTVRPGERTDTLSSLALGRGKPGHYIVTVYIYAIDPNGSVGRLLDLKQSSMIGLDQMTIGRGMPAIAQRILRR